MRRALIDSGASDYVIERWDAVMAQDVLYARAYRQLADRGVMALMLSTLGTVALGFGFAYLVWRLDLDGPDPVVTIYVTMALTYPQMFAAFVQAIRVSREIRSDAPTGIPLGRSVEDMHALGTPPPIGAASAPDATTAPGWIRRMIQGTRRR